MQDWQFRSIFAALALILSAPVSSHAIVGGAAVPAIGAIVTANAERIQRSAKAVKDFRKANPCPATQEPRGPCPGFIVDHVVPLCAGGADAPSNMQWQTVEDAKAKDRDEHRECAALRKAKP